MKKLTSVIIGLLLAISFNPTAWAGILTTNEFIYKPSVGAKGDTEKNAFDAGLDRIDTRLGKEIWVGDPNYGTTLQEAITAIGSTPVILRVPSGTYSVNNDLTTPATLTLRPERGAIFNIATTKTLTINGLLDAGPYQIFSFTGTGKVIFGPGAVKEAPPEWWTNNTTPGTTDMQPAIQAALNSLTSGGTVKLGVSTYLLTSYVGSYSLTWPQINNLSLVGSGMGQSIIRGKDHASTDYNVLLINASSSAGISKIRIADLTISGSALNQAAAPACGILFGDYLYDVAIENVEVKWLRGSPIRSSTSNMGGRYSFRNNYFHDCGTAAQTSAAGSSGGITGTTYNNLEVIDNRIINMGHNGNGCEFWHSIYIAGNKLRIHGNYIEGRGFDIRGGTSADFATISNNTIIISDATDHSCWATGNHITVTGNVVYNGYMECSGSGAVTGNTIYSPTQAAGYGYLAIQGRFTVTGNKVWGSGTTSDTGIYFGSNMTSVGCVATGNQFYNVYNGIGADSARVIADIKLSGNYFEGMTGASYGVSIVGATGTVDRFIVTGNTFKGFTYGAHLSGAGVKSDFSFSRNELSGALALIYCPADPVRAVLRDNESMTAMTYAYHTSTAPSATKDFTITNLTCTTDGGFRTLANSATPYAWLGKTFKTGGTTTITNLLGGCKGQKITILAAHTITLAHNANANPGYVLLSGAANFDMTANKMLTLEMFDQDIWREVARSN